VLVTSVCLLEVFKAQGTLILDEFPGNVNTYFDKNRPLLAEI